MSKKDKTCSTCRHWTDNNVNGYTWPRMEGNYKYCAIEAISRNWEGEHRVGMTKGDACCINQWEPKTNQLELPFSKK